MQADEDFDFMNCIKPSYETKVSIEKRVAQIIFLTQTLIYLLDWMI